MVPALTKHSKLNRCRPTNT